MQIALGLLLVAVSAIAVSVVMTWASTLRPLASMALACILALLFAAVFAGVVIVAMRLING